MFNAFQQVKLWNPLYNAILVGITDDKHSGYFEEVENYEGFYQVLFGCSFPGTDQELLDELFEVLYRATVTCPLDSTDRAALQDVFEEVRPYVLTESEPDSGGGNCG